MICGAEDLIAVCQEKIAVKPHELSADGKFSWEEVECLGSCANAPMAQIGKDYYEDLTAARLGEIIDELAAGTVPVPGPQNGRFAAEPLKGLTSLKGYDSGKTQYNASVQSALDIGDTVKRIDGTEVPLLTPWINDGAVKPATKKAPAKSKAPKAAPKAKAAPAVVATPDAAEKKPSVLKAPRKSGADDLKLISGVGPKLEGVLNELGFWHFDQIAAWTQAEVVWVDSRLKFKGRIVRDNWMEQAATLANKD
jgi:NADH-quinone oxidoreductase subunit E